MVLVSILKSPMSNSPKQINSASAHRVKFNLPTDQKSVIQYFQDENGASYSYKLNTVTKTILSKDTEDSILLRWISEFKDNILFLDKHNEAIAFALLNLKWSTKGETFTAAYQELILNLVTAHPFYLRNVLLMIINVFFTPSSENEDISEEEQKSLQNIHILSKCITELVPLSQFLFCSLLVEKFPYIKVASSVHLHYIQNLLIVCSYIPYKRHLILSCIIEKVIHMDVFCSKEIIEVAELQHQEENDLMFQDVESDLTAKKKQEQMAFPLAHTLDLLMNCMFTYIQKTCFTEDEQLNWEPTKKLYKELLTAFDKIVLPTHGSCHVQYLLFYICSLKQELCDGFLDYLWKKVQNPSAAPVLRQISAFYIGSFLSRAKYVNISTVTACLDLMCSWIHRYIDAHISQDLDVHGTFHSVCQTVFYIFAFRNRELLDMKDGHKYLRNLNFDRIVTCRLNPLRYADRTIVQNFATIARNYQIAYVYPVIERNNRNMLYSYFQSSSEESAAGSMISTFFPFDPYLLKRSKHFVEKLYRLYNHTNKVEENINHIEDEEMPVDDEKFSYSMSPGFKTSFILKYGMN